MIYFPVSEHTEMMIRYVARPPAKTDIQLSYMMFKEHAILCQDNNLYFLHVISRDKCNLFLNLEKEGRVKQVTPF